MGIRLANVEGRAALVCEGRTLDVHRRSDGRFGPDPMAVLADWDAFADWSGGIAAADDDPTYDEARLGAPVPRPAKVFGVGLNYRDHAEEAGLEAPKQPLIFTKFPSCITGPRADVALSSDRVDYEVELVAVIGGGGRRIAVQDALDHVAGYTVGQDISDRRLQFSDKPPQFSMGKSCDTYGPIGPELVSLDGIPHPETLALTCHVNDEKLQDGTTADLIFPVAELVAFLSAHCTLEPGDLIFTGTPAGVGAVRKPPRYLQPGDVITSAVAGVGTLVNRCTAG